MLQQCAGRSMVLVRARPAWRCLYQWSVPACLSLQVGLLPSQPSRKPPYPPPLAAWPRHLHSALQAITTRFYSIKLDDIKYEQISDETLESLSEYLEELVASDAAPQDSDVLYSSGVLTLQLGTLGTYVINKQAPNKQIWLSSPTSGPKRFDFLAGAWVYRHTGDTLHGLLNEELSKVFSADVDFLNCAFAGTEAA